MGRHACDGRSSSTCNSLRFPSYSQVYQSWPNQPKVGVGPDVGQKTNEKIAAKKLGGALSKERCRCDILLLLLCQLIFTCQDWSVTTAATHWERKYLRLVGWVFRISRIFDDQTC